MAETENLQIFAFGTPHIRLNNADIAISRRKALALLIYLVVTQKTVSRESLATLFWPESDSTAAYRSLRVLLWELNKSLGEQWLNVDNQVVGSGDNIWLDVAEFRRTVNMAKADMSRHDHIVLLTEAVALYQDDFMAGFSLRDSPEFDDWQFFESENLRRTFSTALQTLIACFIENHDFQNALPPARRWLALDRLHEPAHRMLMRLYHQTHQRAAALRQYEECVSILNDELATSPESETIALYKAIRENRPLEFSPHQAQEKSASDSAPQAEIEIPALNFPVQNTPFIGRKTERQEILNLLSDEKCRLLTLAGTGGTGKTRLAIEIAEELIATKNPAYRDGIGFIGLAPLNAVDFLVMTIASALNFSPSADKEPLAQLINYLSNKHMLLVMDNFEHMLEGGNLLSQILAQAPGINILVTSRERLNLQEEWLYELEGLNYPTKARPPEEAETYSAIQLFLQSARRVQSGFTLMAKNTLCVARICQLVEGMPLGIELAAAWMEMLTCDEIRHEIECCYDFLEGSLRNLPPRHRSMRAVFKSSWDRLSPLEQRVFSKLAVFQGGFDHEAARFVADASLPMLRNLLNKSLIRRHPDGRYDIHEFLRQFAAEKLTANPAEQERAYGLYSQYYADFLQIQEQRLRGHEQLEALNAIAGELVNIRMMWLWAVEHRHVERLQQAVIPLGMYYDVRSLFQEGKELFGKTLPWLENTSDSAHQELRAHILTYMGIFCFNLSFARQARASLTESIRLFDSLGLRKKKALSLYILAALQPPDIEDITLEKEALAIGRECNDTWILPGVLISLAIVHMKHQEYEQSRQYFEEAASMCQASGNRWWLALTQFSYSFLNLDIGNYTLARQQVREAVTTMTELGDHPRAAIALNIQGYVELTMGHYEEARRIFEESRALYEERGENLWVMFAHASLGDVALMQHNYETACQIYEQTLVQIDETGFSDSVVRGYLLKRLIETCQAMGNPAKAAGYEAQGEKLAQPMTGRTIVAWGLNSMGWISRAASICTPGKKK